MPVVSIRFGVNDVHSRLKAAAARKRLSASALAERLIDEGLRMEVHPLVGFRDGPAGRRAVLLGGPDVVEVVSAVVGGDVPLQARVERAADLLGLATTQIEAAIAYYADFTTEIDDERHMNEEAAEREEALWRRGRELLSG